MSREEYRRRRRRRRMVRGTTRVVVWALVVSATFLLGLGFGRMVTREEAGDASPKVTVENERGTITATLPVTTVVSVKTVVKVKTVRVAKKSSSGDR